MSFVLHPTLQPQTVQVINLLEHKLSYRINGPLLVVLCSRNDSENKKSRSLPFETGIPTMPANRIQVRKLPI
jgi:hypothetical protein